MILPTFNLSFTLLMNRKKQERCFFIPLDVSIPLQNHAGSPGSLGSQMKRGKSFHLLGERGNPHHVPSGVIKLEVEMRGCNSKKGVLSDRKPFWEMLEGVFLRKCLCTQLWIWEQSFLLSLSICLAKNLNYNKQLCIRSSDDPARNQFALQDACFVRSLCLLIKNKTRQIQLF